MKEDLDRWNSRFRDREIAAVPDPDPWLSARNDLPLHQSGSDALDLASGSGHNAVWLATKGFRVTAIDGSHEGMRLALQLAKGCGVVIRPIVADLDQYPLTGSFDLIVVTHYLNRILMPRLGQHLNPGGMLYARTFNRDFLKQRPGINSDYTLAPGELLQLFEDLVVIDHAESPPGDVGNSHIFCRRQ
ncbi:MAG: hypothetical protein DHS20C01_34610 [marine bacterium B5-7]|nr:MAG: hypothetical protein DHS20C01_34610 [marine bacterium B5-7]